jgi:hypothetical protein
VDHFYLRGDTFWESSPKLEDSPLLKKLIDIKDYILSKEGSVAEANNKITSRVKDGVVQTKEAYEYFRDHSQKVYWAKAVWVTEATPKYSILWLATKDRLLTRDKLHLEGQDKICPLCRMGDETGSHLFFHCSFVAQVWEEIRSWLGMCRKMTILKSSLKWIRKEVKWRSMQTRAKRVVVSTSVYHIWITRNKCILHGPNEVRPV